MVAVVACGTAATLSPEPDFPTDRIRPWATPRQFGPSMNGDPGPVEVTDRDLLHRPHEDPSRLIPVRPFTHPPTIPLQPKGP